MAHMRRAENSDTRSQGFDRGRGHLNHHSDRPRYSPPFEGELGGHLFLTNHQQIEENFARQIFGLPKQHAPTVLRIKEGLPLFLYNTSTRALHGVFEAASDGGLNLEPDAWQDHALSAQLKQPFSKFPAQVRFRVRADRGRLAEPKFRDILDYHTSDYNTHFRLPLSIEQANHLLELFNMAPSGPRPAPPTAEQPSAAGDVIDEGDWEQVKTKPRTKPLKVQPGNSYGRQVGSPTGPSTPRRRAEGPRPGHQGPVGNGDVGGGRGGPDRWRPDGGDWAARAGGRQHTGSVWGAREGAAKEGGAKEGALKEDAGVGRAEERGSKAEVRENGILETGPAKLSPRKPGAQAAKEAPFSSPREAGILGSGSAAVEQAEGKGQVAESVTTVADPPAKPGKAAVKSSTFSYSAALKVGLPAKMEDISASEKGRGGASDTAGKAGGAENESGEVFPVLSKSNSKNERVAKAPKKEHVAVVVKNEDGETKDADRKDTEKKDDEKEDAVKKDGVEKSGKKGDGEKKAEASKVGDDMSEKKDGKKVEAKKDAEKAAGDRKEAPKSKGDPLQAPKSPKSKSEAGEALVGAQKAEPSPPAKPEPVKAPEKPKPNPWGKLPTPIEPVSLAEVQQKEQEQQAELSHAARREPQAKPAIGDREGAVDRTKEAVALHEGGERREAAKPVGRGWEAKKPELQQPVVQVQAPQKGGGAFAPPLRQKTPPRMQHPQPLAARRGEPAPVTDLSALPPSAPERIQQRSMGNLVGGIPARNRTPPLSHHSHRPQPVQVPAPQSLGTGVRISPTATPYTPNSAGFTPSATPFTPSGRLSPGLRGYGPPMGVLQTPPPMFAADPSLAYDQSWRMPRGRNAPPPRANGGVAPPMVYSPTTPPDYGYALAALSPSSQPGTPLGPPAMATLVGGGLLPPPPPELLANADALHWEVLRYAEKARRTPEARARAESAVLCVRRAIQALWPAADVEIFGSFSTGLCLPHSDVDLAVVGAPPPPIELANVPGGRPLVPLIRELAAVLRTSPWLDTLTTIETASMPVIKLRCKPGWENDSAPGGSEESGSTGGTETDASKGGAEESQSQGDAEKSQSTGSPEEGESVSGAAKENEEAPGKESDAEERQSEASGGERSPSQAPPVAIDITIMGRRGQPMGTDGKEGPPPKSQHNGASARQFVIERLQRLPALAPLVLLLKSYLHHRGLNDVYTGGLGSFSLTLMLVFYLERVAFIPMEAPPVPVASTSGNDASAGVNASAPAATRAAAEIPGKESSDPTTAPETSSISEETDQKSVGTADEDPSNAAKTTSVSGNDEEPESIRGTTRAGGKVVGMTEPADWLTSGPMPNLGALLIGFLHLFGNELDLATVRLVLKSNGQNGGIFYHDKLTRPVALWIDDPLRPGANIGAGSFAMYNVQAALREMLKFLSTPRVAPPRFTDESSLIEQLFSQVYPERVLSRT